MRSIDKMMNVQIKAFYATSAFILKKGLSSDRAFDKAVDKIEKLAEKLYNKMEKFAPHMLTDDQSPMSLNAQVASDAIGTNTAAHSTLKAKLIDGPLVSVALASATSFAATEGGAEIAVSATFTNAPGADMAFTKVTKFSGKNFEAAREVMVAVDLQFWESPGFDFTRERNITSNRIVADVEDGNVATVKFHASAEGENTFVSVQTDALAVEDILSTSSISADLFIA
jgi:hypothetical protein